MDHWDKLARRPNACEPWRLDLHKFMGISNAANVLILCHQQFCPGGLGQQRISTLQGRIKKDQPPQQSSSKSHLRIRGL